MNAIKHTALGLGLLLLASSAWALSSDPDQPVEIQADVFEAQGDVHGRDRLIDLVRRRMESWFSGADRKTYFLRDTTIGTVLAYPEEYFSVEQMNDHHFHYGYWIRSAAEIALRDPEWAAPHRWGGVPDSAGRMPPAPAARDAGPGFAPGAGPSVVGPPAR